MYPADLEIKDKTESNTSASYLGLLLLIGREGQVCTFLNNKCDNFNFTSQPFRSWTAILHNRQPMMFLSRNSYAMLLLWMFYYEVGAWFIWAFWAGFHWGTFDIVYYEFLILDLIKQYKVSLSQILHDILEYDWIHWHPPLIRHYSNSLHCYRVGSYCRLGPFH